MRPGYQLAKVLMVVKTYPHPSEHHEELVCTADITSEGRWIRLYPVPFRLLKDEQRFPKYTWIEVGVQRRPSDTRPESHHIDPDTIKPLETLPADGFWLERRKVIDPTISPSLCDLMRRYDVDQTSLGIFKPKTIHDLIIKPNTQDWSDKQKGVLFKREHQISLFGKDTPDLKLELKLLPWSFSYKFDCDDLRCKGHKLSVKDWELGAAYWSWLPKYGDETPTKIREKWLDTMCAPDRDTHFIVGTHYPYKTWLHLGTYWPKEIKQLSLF